MARAYRERSFSLVTLALLGASFIACDEQASEGSAPGGTFAAPAQPAPAAGAAGAGAVTGGDDFGDVRVDDLASPGASGASGEAASDAAPMDAAPPSAADAGPAVRFVGRMDRSDPGGPRFAWSGSGVVARFEGTSVAVSLNDSGQNQLTVLIDGELSPPLDLEAGARTYQLASELPAGEHVVELYRRTEASWGVTQWLSFDFGPSGRLLPPPQPERRIELIGDSISTGYGNEGADVSCGFSPETQNHYLTYGAISARALGAELVTVAWSGKGVVYNYDTDVEEPMPELYERTLPADPSSTWDFSIVPDAVVINLGTNDFSTDGDPTPELFRAEYLGLLTTVRQHYPEAYILCTVGNLLSGEDLAAARAGIAASVEELRARGDTRIEAWEMNVPNENPGCDYHPSVPTHQAMAEALTPRLAAALGLTTP